MEIGADYPGPYSPVVENIPFNYQEKKQLQHFMHHRNNQIKSLQKLLVTEVVVT